MVDDSQRFLHKVMGFFYTQNTLLPRFLENIKCSYTKVDRKILKGTPSIS